MTFRLLMTICMYLSRCFKALRTGAVRLGCLEIMFRLPLVGMAGQRRPQQIATVTRLLVFTLLLVPMFATTASAYDVDNVARIDYVDGGTNISINSNQVTVVVTPPPSVATAEFLHLTGGSPGTTLPATEFSDSDPPGTFSPILPNPGPGALSSATDYFEGELVVIRVNDSDQNLEPLLPDSILVRLDVPVSGDNELLRLDETGINTGVFEGYIYAGTTAVVDYNGYLTAPATSQIDLSYDDSGPILSLSAPVIPAPPGSLWLQMATNRNEVSIGDFYTYTLTVENLDVISATGVTVDQELPPGIRYEAGSTTLDGSPIADPIISADGRSLTYTIGDMLPGAMSELGFRVIVGTVPPGRYRSDAIAQATSGQVSNAAGVSIMVRDELGNSKSIVAGRVLAGCNSNIGVEGVRIYMEDGTFVLTDSQGRYHIEGVDPGTHVLQIDPITLPAGYDPAFCEETTRFADNPASRFIELLPGSLWRADFYISDRPINGEVSIALNNTYSLGTPATYTVSLAGKDVPLSNRRLVVELPKEVTYLPGSSNLNMQALADPVVNGQTLTYSLPDKLDQWQETIIIRTQLDRDTASEEIVAQARLHFDTPARENLVTPNAESTLIWVSRGERADIQELLLRPQFETLDAKLSSRDLEELNKAIDQISALELIKIYVIGHTDARRIRWKDGIPYKDNFELSEARAEAVARALLDSLDLNPDQVVSVGMAAAVPLADNRTVEGLAQNRRTELRVLHRIIIDPEMERVDAGGGDPKSMKAPNVTPPPSADSKDVAPGIISPTQGQNLPHSIAPVKVRIDEKLKPRLSLDGTEIPASRIGFKMNEGDYGTNLYTYIGVNFGKPGQHMLKIEGIDPFGNSRFSQEITLNRTDEIDRIVAIETEGNVADGRSPIRIKLALYDKHGQLIPDGAKLEIRGGRLTPAEVKDDHLPGAPETNLLHVDSNGIATFEPVSQAGRYPLTIGFGNVESDIDIFVSPEKREWILVGLGEGTTGYNNISDNVKPLDPSVPKEDYYDDGRIAFFAKGQIKGEWLLTVAYDSDKEGRKDRTLHQIIDPGSYYTVYADSTSQGYEAASSEKLFIRIEKDRFYSVFGDIDTGMNVTELSRYNRSLTGIKSEWIGRNFGYTAFASETAQNFVRDEIQGDGTSGLYRLSQNEIVINSDKVTLETRDRYHSEQILLSRQLQRHIDYDIDYGNGTIFFKEPVPSRDQNFNPIFIIIDYESEANGAEDYTYGGRVFGRTKDGKFEIGASMIHEGRNSTESGLAGVDLKAMVSESTSINAEWATSETITAPAVKTDGDAWLAEIEHRTNRFDVTAYVREQESGFGLGQQNASESATRKLGADLAYRISKNLDIETGFYLQENMETGTKRNVEHATANYHTDRYSLSAGLRHAEDDQEYGPTETSDQLTLGADYHVTRKLDLIFRHEQSIGNNKNRDYPTRTLLGANYQLNRWVNFFAEQEFTDGEAAETANTRIGLDSTPWDGGQIRTSMEQNLSEAGRRVFGNLGLLQTWQINPKLALNFSVDRSELLSGQNQPSFQPDQPPASGSSEDFTALSTGLSYREIDWTFDTRLEYRTSDSEDKWGLFAGSIVEPETFLGLSLHGSYFETDRSDQSRSRDADLSFGIAYRPDNRSWIVLNRLDLVSFEDETPMSKITHWKVIERLNAFWRVNARNRLSFKLGTRYAADEFDTVDYSGMTWLAGTEWRHDISKRIDIGLHGSVLQVEELSQSLYHTGASVGYSPAKNFWISLGYNYQGFQDDDFSQADYTAQGPYVKFRFKFDQNSIRSALEWLQKN